jgi:hypothetical protein
VLWSASQRLHSLIRVKRGLKFDLRNHLRGLKETQSIGTPQQRRRFHWKLNYGKQITTPIYVVLLAICFPLSLSKFSCLSSFESFYVAPKVNSALIRATRARRTTPPYSDYITSHSNVYPVIEVFVFKY